MVTLGRKYKEKEIREAKLVLQGLELQPETTVPYLGISLDYQLKWNEHIKKLRAKCFRGMAQLRRVCRDLPFAVRKKLYCALIQPHTDYCSVVWDHLTVEQENKVEAIQNAGMRLILGAPRTATGTEMRQKLGWTTLAQRRKLHALKVAHKCIHKTGPAYLHSKFQHISDLRDRQTRGSASGEL